MKNLLSILCLMITATLSSGQITDKPVSSPHLIDTGDKIPSGLYTLADLPADNVLFSGQTTHFSDLTFQFETIHQKDGMQHFRMVEEQILIIKEGKATVALDQETKTIGPNSVVFILPGEEGFITSKSASTSYYRMIYKSFNPPVLQENDHDISSFIVDYDNLEFHKTNKGGVRKYFNRSTAMCPYYEMHVTTLNPGLQSHKPHTHEAAEIILIIKGETEEEINGKTYRGEKGDVYFLVSNSLHTIRNIGDEPCQYIAFQWGTSSKK